MQHSFYLFSKFFIKPLIYYDFNIGFCKLTFWIGDNICVNIWTAKVEFIAKATDNKYLQFRSNGFCELSSSVASDNIRHSVCFLYPTPLYHLLYESCYKFLTWHISGVARYNLTFSLESLTFLSIIVPRTFWRATIIVYSDLKKLIWQKYGINS